MLAQDSNINANHFIQTQLLLGWVTICGRVNRPNM